MTDHADILRQIQALLDAAKPALDDLEDTLTSGYAAALALEAERWRIERGIAEAAATLGDDGEGARTQELVRLGRRLSAAADDLARLRTMLGTLRDRTAAARAAA